MAEDLKITITAKDNYSNFLKNMQSETKAFGKDMDGLQGKLDLLNKTKATLQVDASKAKKELRKAQKAYDEFGDSASEQLITANFDYEQAHGKLSLLEREISNVQDAFDQSLKGIKGKNELVAELGGQLGISLVNGFSARLSGELGEDTGDAIGTILSNVISMTATGFAMSFGDPITTGISAGIGLVKGFVDVATQQYETEKDAFRAVLKDQFITQQNGVQNEIVIGSALAAQREDEAVNNANSENGEQNSVQSKPAFAAQQEDEAVKNANNENSGQNSVQSEPTYNDVLAKRNQLKENALTAYGKGYNEEHKKGLQQQIEMLETNSKMIEEKNLIIGAAAGKMRSKLEMETLEEELAVYRNSNDPFELMANLAVAKTAGPLAYYGSEEYKAFSKSRSESMKLLGFMLSDEESYKNISGYNLNKELNSIPISRPIPNQHNSVIDTWEKFYPTYASPPLKAFGMGYVPYNGFPAILHEGERVLTASENRAYNQWRAPNIVLNLGGTYHVRQAADIEAIAHEIAVQVTRAQELM